MIDTLAAWIAMSGSGVYILAPLFTVLVAILPIPAEIPAMVNGMAFGPVWGAAVTWVSALVGAQISFELSRRFGRPLAQRFVTGVVIDRADRLVARAAWPMLLGLRLLPTVAFTAINWGAGLTAMRRTTFLWTTAVGILPGAIVFTSTGAGLGVLLDRAGGRPLAIGVTVAVLTVSILVTIWLCRPDPTSDN
jgi:uncharacterized membrane protein YdjX (TVP38/TMEM64 family)